jgi:hypothetical protein
MRVSLILIGVLSHCRKLCSIITGPIPVIFSFVYGCVITYWFNSGKFDNCYSAKYTEVARAEAIAVICVPFLVMALSCVAFACLVHKEQQKAHSYQVRAQQSDRVSGINIIHPPHFIFALFVQAIKTGQA